MGKLAQCLLARVPERGFVRIAGAIRFERVDHEVAVLSSCIGHVQPALPSHSFNRGRAVEDQPCHLDLVHVVRAMQQAPSWKRSRPYPEDLIAIA